MQYTHVVKDSLEARRFLAFFLAFLWCFGTRAMDGSPEPIGSTSFNSPDDQTDGGYTTSYFKKMAEEFTSTSEEELGTRIKNSKLRSRVVGRKQAVMGLRKLIFLVVANCLLWS